MNWVLQTSNILNGMKVAFLIIGTTIGAGFASGREIWEFFTSYGEGSSIYIILSMVLFSISCYIILSISHQLQAPHYVMVLQEIIGVRLGRVYDGLIFFYLLSTTVVMFAGSGATLEYWALSYWLGVVLMGAFVLVVFLKDVEGIMSLNSVLIPIMIITLIGVCGLFLSGGFGQDASGRAHANIFPSSIAFTALNILPLIAVLSALGARLNRSEIKVASLVSAIGLSTIAYLYNQSLLLISHEISLFEVPLFGILRYLPENLLLSVTFVLWLAIYTTAISGIFGLVSRFRESVNLPQWMIAGIFIVLVIPLTKFGFSNLVRILYPLYGVLNLFILSMILLYPLANWRKIR
jgi:uncharacterized membrane protein YkvI